MAMPSKFVFVVVVPDLQGGSGHPELRPDGGPAQDLGDGERHRGATSQRWQSPKVSDVRLASGCGRSTSVVGLRHLFIFLSTQILSKNFEYPARSIASSLNRLKSVNSRLFGGFV